MVISSSHQIWEDFFKRYYWEAILSLANDYPDKRSLYIDFTNIERFDIDLARELIEHPDSVLKHANEALMSIDLPVADVLFTTTHVRIINVPEHIKIRNLRSSNINKFIAVSGLIRKATEVRPKIINAAFKCQRCDTITYMPQSEGKFIEPFECENDACGRKGPFKLIHEESVFVDAQKLRIQESPDDMKGGEQPQTLDVDVDDDLTGVVTPGDRVVISGILRSYQRSTIQGKSTFFDLVIDGNSIEIEDKEFEDIEISKEDIKNIHELGKDSEIYTKVIRSIAPSIYGYDEVKESIALQLFSGVYKHLPDKTRIRGDIHVLLVGDPGVAKSQLLRYAVKLAPRGIYTSGKSSTSAGLTAAAVKDDFGEGRWTLEAGALVLADMGLACIEENQYVITSSGLKKIKDIKVGDEIINYDTKKSYGIVKNVLDKGIKQTLKIKTYTGDVIECTHDHKILTSRGWVKAEEITEKDYLIIPSDDTIPVVKNKEKFEFGFIMGFALCDIEINEQSNKNVNSFSSSQENKDRTEHILNLINEHYGVKFSVYDREAKTKEIRGCKVEFRGTLRAYGSSKKLKEDIFKLFHENTIENDIDFKIGFISGILSKNCFISHKKHVIEIGLGRKKYSSEWLSEKIKLVNSIFHGFGILSVMRRKDRRIIISSLKSYNKIVEIFSEHIVGDNKLKLFKVEPKIKIASYDDILNYDYALWFNSIKFKTSKTVKLGLHSRIYNARKNNKVTVSLMETLRIHWSEITDETFREINKTYILNKVVSIISGSQKHVYDLSIDKVHNFLISGGIVHNCIDELDKMNSDDRSSMHEAMEQQSYHPKTEIMFSNGEKIEIGKFVDELINSNIENVIYGNDCEILNLNENFKVLTTDFKKVYPTFIDRVSRHKPPKYFIKITYSNGRSITVTPEHPIYILKSGEIKEIRADSVKKGMLAPAVINSDIYFVEIKDIEILKNENVNWVYDVTIEPNHTFISEGLVLHNTISIAKAGIMATLKSRCAVLGAANPKFGRFDRFEPIAKQINMPPALLSRFDLIFILTDEPSVERDTAIANHIIKAHYAGELSMRKQNVANSNITNKEITEAMEVIVPIIDSEMLRKYIAYTKRNIFPIIQPDAKSELINFYLGLRKQGEDPNSPVPVTARQLEALIRLAEASARMRLSDVITKSDTLRVIRIVKESLKQVMTDPETGKIDSDMINVGIGKSQRDKIKSLRQIIREVQDEHNGTASIDEIIAKAEQNGIKKEKVEDMIHKLKSAGEIIEPTTEKYRVV